MAEGDGAVYNDAKEQLLRGTVNFATGTLMVALLAGYTPNIDSHDTFSDVSGNEESGTGYTAGGEQLGGQAVAQDNTNDRASFDATDVTWTGLDVGTPSHAVLYEDDTSSQFLIAYWELGRASNGGNYTLQWHADGILLVT